MKTKIIISTLFTSLFMNCIFSNHNAQKWEKYELSFTSDKIYNNVLYDVKQFYAVFNSPSGNELKINGFWDGHNIFKVRFAPGETGEWTYRTFCSDEGNTGLHGQTGRFICDPNNSNSEIFQRGPLVQPQGTYYLTYTDGKPFFWVACTAWNGALKSTDEEWDTYLKQRKENNYSAIQYVTTQWRGCDKNSRGEKAYTFDEYLEVNPSFFKLIDEKTDEVNEYGLIAAPVLLWALPFGEGRALSPGYELPLEEAVLLAKYIIARLQGNQVVWILGGDGRYAHEYEQRWLEIGQRVFEDDPPGLVAQHPHGRLWIGDNHANEEWLDIVGYQSSHSNKQGTVDWINKGPIGNRWDKIPAKPIINLEPNYEEINNNIYAEDVRNASYWSIFATPIAGITYGANGIWPWIREGEKILNHGNPKKLSTWRTSIDFPGSIQIGYLAGFLEQFDWWKFRPANQLLVEQPGNETYNHFISVTKSIDNSVILAYVPHESTVKLYNPLRERFTAKWFNPQNNTYLEANLKNDNGKMAVSSPGPGDFILILKKKQAK